MSKKTNIILSDQNLKDIETIKRHTGHIEASAAIRYAITVTADNISTSGFPPAQSKPAQPKTLTRPAPKPSQRYDPVEDES